MKPLTRNPTLLTALLSVATLAGYVSYRLTLGSAPDTSVTIEVADTNADHEHEEELGVLPEIVLEDFAGTPTSLTSFADKPLLINFWATWCAPCLREIPLLKEFHEQHESIDVVGIAVDRLDPVLEYAEEMQFNYPSLIGQSDAYEAMALLHNHAQVMPFSAFTAPGGQMLGVHYGELHAEHLENFATTLTLLDSGSIDLEQARERIGGLR